MADNDKQSEKDNLKERAENLKNTVSEKAEEFAKEAKGKAENFAERTLDAAEEIINNVFGKNKPQDAEFEEEKTDPKDIEIVELKKELEELRDKYVRLYADFDNSRKRNAKEKLEIIMTASKDVIKELLPVIDDFERAQKALASSSDNAAKEGMNLIYTKLINNLSAKGLKAMESVGQDFNPELHDAITEIPASTPEQAGKVLEEVEKGYYLNDKIIRHAKVIVGK